MRILGAVFLTGKFKIFKEIFFGNWRMRMLSAGIFF